MFYTENRIRSSVKENFREFSSMFTAEFSRQNTFVHSYIMLYFCRENKNGTETTHGRLLIKPVKSLSVSKKNTMSEFSGRLGLFLSKKMYINIFPNFII